MGVKTGIEWTDATWNPIRGCSPVSPGCKNCYAKKVAYRFSGPGQPYEGLVRINAAGERTDDWNGEIQFVEKHLLDPLRWKPMEGAAWTDENTGKVHMRIGRPRRIFVNSMSDLFHENVTDEMRDKIFAVMFSAPRHTFQVLTKRPTRMREYFSPDNPRYTARRIADEAFAMGISQHCFDCDIYFPLMNVWLGVSVENQATADERIPLLLQTPAAVRFISAEPLLGPIRLDECAPYQYEGFEGNPGVMNAFNTMCYHPATCRFAPDVKATPQGINWVICGGESGPGARPMHPEWARGLRDQCAAAGVPFFFKQWGEWLPRPIQHIRRPEDAGKLVEMTTITSSDRKALGEKTFWAFPSQGIVEKDFGPLERLEKVGKHDAGSMLDGKSWNQFPELI